MAKQKERTALITGASQGLGLALARGLAARGWNLILTARDAGRLKAARDELARVTHVAALAGDVTEADHRAALAVLAQGHAGLDALVNNAGTLGPSPLPALLDYPVDRIGEVFRANAGAPLALIQALRGALKPGARILNVTSDAAVNAYPGWGLYGASKAALEQLSAVLAVENPELRVYSVDPGDMRTEMHQAAYPGEDISDRPLPESRVPGFFPLLEGELPSGRYLAAELAKSSERPLSAVGAA
jgi:NAD(P)-dependent dehydrogenase (short-subunit alcohol dehydrogenase family)